jgi:hypothetical protein
MTATLQRRLVIAVGHIKDRHPFWISGRPGIVPIV